MGKILLSCHKKVLILHKICQLQKIKPNIAYEAIRIVSYAKISPLNHNSTG
jgi:hypothetical protein